MEKPTLKVGEQSGWLVGQSYLEGYNNITTQIEMRGGCAGDMPTRRHAHPALPATLPNLLIHPGVETVLLKQSKLNRADHPGLQGHAGATTDAPPRTPS